MPIVSFSIYENYSIDTRDLLDVPSTSIQERWFDTMYYDIDQNGALDALVPRLSRNQCGDHVRYELYLARGKSYYYVERLKGTCSLRRARAGGLLSKPRPTVLE